MLDYLIVGAGLTGATLARRLTDAGHRCLVFEARDHVAGNCYTREHSLPATQERFLVHEHGPHSFHTNDERVWQWVNRFAQWEPFSLRVKAFLYGMGIVSMPINLMTFFQFWGVSTPEGARKRLSREVDLRVRGTDAEAFLLRTVGRELYETLYEGYTEKQWGTHPSKLPSSIVSRLPVRFSFDDRYHTAKHRALPVGGYTGFVKNMLSDIDVELQTKFRHSDRRLARRVIYTGAPDVLYGCDLGALPYRSLRFRHELLDIPDYQGAPVINYPEHRVPFTRSIEHKHFHGGPAGQTLVTFEYPSATGEPYYPVPAQENITLAKQYRKRAEDDGILCTGRLGTYRYLNMDGAIAAALQLADRL